MKRKNSDKLSISDWSLSDRPREKYMEKGMGALTDAELVAILLRSGNHHETAVSLAIRLLQMNKGKLDNLAKMTLKELLAVHGIGEAKAIAIKAAFELGQRRRAEMIHRQPQISQARDVLEIMQDKIANIGHEEFWVLFMNQGGRLLLVENFSKGGLTSAQVDIRLVARKALELMATGVILCHNHPSGDVRPSDADLSLTQSFKVALDFFQIRCVDHVVLCGNQYYSFAEQGLI